MELTSFPPIIFMTPHENTGGNTFQHANVWSFLSDVAVECCKWIMNHGTS